MTPQELYESNIPLIDRVIRQVCRRSYVAGADAEDFRQSVHVKLIQNDYWVLRNFDGDSSLETYLRVVVRRHLLDWRNQKWGKLRASAVAKRLGKVAIRLEELMRRDRLTTDQAVETLLTNHRKELEAEGIKRADLERMAVLIPPPQPREIVSDAVLENQPAKSRRPEEGVIESELALLYRRLIAALENALRKLPADDRLILEMCVLGKRKIADAARFLRLPQKPLYRRLEKVLARMRETLEKEGFTRDEVAQLLRIREIRWD